MSLRFCEMIGENSSSSDCVRLVSSSPDDDMEYISRLPSRSEVKTILGSWAAHPVVANATTAANPRHAIAASVK